LPRERREDKGDQVGFTVCKAYYLERCLLLIIDSGSEDGHDFKGMLFREYSQQVLRYGRKQLVAPGQWIAHREVTESVPRWAVLLEKDAAVADVARYPAPLVRLGDEGVGEIGGVGKGTSKRGGRVRRLGGVESIIVDETEERRRVAFAEAAEEGALGDDAAETGAGGRGACKRGRGRQA
jgi:hypothetical protein